jgi:hypothetical protein
MSKKPWEAPRIEHTGSLADASGIRGTDLDT